MKGCSRTCCDSCESCTQVSPRGCRGPSHLPREGKLGYGCKAANGYNPGGARSSRAHSLAGALSFILFISFPFVLLARVLG